MTIFLRLLDDEDKSRRLKTSCNAVRYGAPDGGVFQVEPEAFRLIPGAPFAYWVGDSVRRLFVTLKSLVDSGGEAWMGLSSGGDFQWLRLCWEVPAESISTGNVFDRSSARWAYLSKGGEFLTFYPSIHILVDWQGDGARLESWKSAELAMGRITANNSKCWNKTKYFRRGGTWSRRSQRGLSFRALPAGTIFGDKGPAAFVSQDDPSMLLAFLAIANSAAYRSLVKLQMAFGSYEVGVIQRTPLPNLSSDDAASLANLASKTWKLKRQLDTTQETSQAFLLPALLRDRLGPYCVSAIEEEIAQVQAQIDEVAFRIYGFSSTEQHAASSHEVSEIGQQDEVEEEDTENLEGDIPPSGGLLSWAVGVAFGRFDWRLATGARAAPPDPDPFDPLPAKSPGMLLDAAVPFHSHAGILVDDQGHPHHLPRLVEEVLARVDVPVPEDVRRWLQRDFFAFHLQRYSKSRRKAPIYWPLSTTSGGYTLWVYYPGLNSQTLYTAINDFVEPKLQHVGADVTKLRNKGSARTRDDEKQFEALQAFELELIELRDTLLKLAPGYKPNHDDGVQISAAPLWPLFRHKPWQRVLKDTWTKLEKGDYDWAHLAMNYWSERVREKCKTDKSLAVAHGLEHLYVEPEASPKKTRGRKKAGGDE
jgi:hypothetical protein